jgi:hypothetical protein
MGFNKRLISQADGEAIGDRVLSVTNSTQIATLSGNDYFTGVAFYNGTIYTNEVFLDASYNQDYAIRKRNTSGGVIATYYVSSPTISGVPYLGGVDGIFVDNSGNIYVCDEKDVSASAELRKYNNSGVFQSKFVIVSNFYQAGLAYDTDRDYFFHGRHSSNTVYIKDLSGTTQSNFNIGAEPSRIFYAENQLFRVSLSGSNAILTPYDIQLGSLEPSITVTGNNYFNTSSGYDSANGYLYHARNERLYRSNVTIG